MKFRLICMVLLGALGVSLLAEDIELSDGRKFSEASIRSETATRVVIQHKGGLTGVNKDLLPPALAAKFPLKPDLALEESRRAESARKVAAQREAELRKAAEEQAERQQRQQANEEAQNRMLVSRRAKAVSVGTGLLQDYFSKNYSVPMGARASYAVQVKEAQMTGDSPNRWRLSGSVSIQATRDAQAVNNSADPVLTPAEERQINPRDRRARRGATQFQSSETYAFDADLDNLDGVPTISVTTR